MSSNRRIRHKFCSPGTVRRTVSVLLFWGVVLPGVARPLTAQEPAAAPETAAATAPEAVPAASEMASTGTAMTTVTTSSPDAAVASVDHPEVSARPHTNPAPPHATTDIMTMAFVFMLATFIGIGVIRRVSRLLHTPLMSLTNAISAISVVGAIIVAGGEHYPTGIRLLGAIALFASMTNIVSGFLITDRMLKMFKTREGGKA